MPILKALDLLSERLTDAKLAPYIKAVREEVKNGSLLSDAFARQGVFPPIYVTSVLAGEKSGALGEVLDRFITYQKLALAVRKKIILSLVYPCLLIVLVICLMVFLITFVVPKFAELYSSMSAQSAGGHPNPDRDRNHGAQLHPVRIRGRDRGGGGVPVLGENRKGRRAHGSLAAAHAGVGRNLDQIPGGAVRARAGHAAGGRHSADAGAGYGLQFARHAAAEEDSGRSWENGEGRAVAFRSRCSKTKIFPGLSIDMIEVGESTGALPQMLASVAEFYEDDVNTRMTASLSLIEPAIMIVHGRVSSPSCWLRCICRSSPWRTRLR